MNVTYVLYEVYNGIYSAQEKTLTRSRYTSASIPMDSSNTVYLVHTEGEKADLFKKECGRGINITKSQGLTCKSIVIIETTAIKRIGSFAGQMKVSI